MRAVNNTKRWISTLLVSAAAAQTALDVLEGEPVAGSSGPNHVFDDGQYHPNSAPTTTHNHIESVLEVFSQILTANYPYYTPSTIDVQALTWPQTLDIFGTTLTANPSQAAPTQTQNAESLTKATTNSKSATTSISTTQKSSSRTSASSASSSATTTSSASTTSSAQPSSSTSAGQIKQHGNKDGDRGIAIIFGILVSLIAVALAAAIFWLLWRRKRKSGSFFKPARCSVCTTATTEPLTSNLSRSMSVTPWRLEATEPSRSYMATINYLNPKTSGGGGAATAAAGGYLGPNDSGEQLPEPVPKPYVRHQVIQVDPVHPVYGRGPTRLQKSNSTIRRGVPELLPVPGPSDSHELAGDDLAAISEMDTESPSRRVSTWTTNPFVAAEQEANEALPSSSVAEREAAYFRTHSRDNSRDFPPYADNPAVTIETASITSSEERSDLLGRGESFDSDPDSIGPVGPPSSPPDSPNWVSMPLSNQERAMDANANPSAPGFGFSSSRTPANIPPALLAGGLRNMRGSPLPFSPRWRRNGHVPERKPSPPTPAFHRPSPVTDSPFRENFAKFNQSSSPVYSVPGVSPLTPSRSNPSPLLRNRIAEENRYLAEPTVHYPSWSEISEFNFADRPQTAGSQREEDGGDGWRPVTSRSYEMAL